MYKRQVVHGPEAGEPLGHPVRQHEHPLHERHVAGLSEDASNPRIVLGEVQGILGAHADDVADVLDVPQGGQGLVLRRNRLDDILFGEYLNPTIAPKVCLLYTSSGFLAFGHLRPECQERY